MFRAIRHIIQLCRIAYVLAKHDALFCLEETRVAPAITFVVKLVRKPTKLPRGKRLANALKELGPSFIKLGQVLSTRSDLVGDDIARDLSELQDKLPPFPSRIARAIIEQSFGMSVQQLFAEFEDEPVAAASIAQVHFARTKQGEEVAVKILRPNVAAIMQRDIDLFYWLASLAERGLPGTRRLKPREVVHTFEDALAFELDLRYEASAAVELKQNTKNDEGFYVPTIYWHLTRQNVLTSERIYGVPVNDVAMLMSGGYDLPLITQYAANAFFNQVFRDGFFHADLHPGNIFVLEDNRIAVVDFGIMGRLDRKNRIFLAEILRGFLFEDYQRIAEIHFEAHIVPHYKSKEQFAQACRVVAKPLLDKPLNEISVGGLLGQLFQMSETFEMQLQPQFLLLQKTMMLSEGVGRMLNPQVNMWKLAEPMIQKWASENLSQRAILAHTLKETASRLQQLPDVLDKFDRTLSVLSQGTFSLSPQTLRELQRKSNRNSFLIIFTILLIFLLFADRWMMWQN